MRWAELALAHNFSRSLTMNWTGSTLHRTSRRKPGKGYTACSRQRNQFAQARRHVSAEKHTPSPAPGSSPAPSRHSNVSRRSHSSTERRISHEELMMPDFIRSQLRAQSEESPLLTISQFLASQEAEARGEGQTNSRHKYDERGIERARRKLLASKDWSIRVKPVSPPKRSRHFAANRASPGAPQGANKAAWESMKRRQEIWARKIRRSDIRIRVGSQEKRLGDTWTTNRPHAQGLNDLISSPGDRTVTGSRVPLPRDERGTFYSILS